MTKDQPKLLILTQVAEDLGIEIKEYLMPGFTDWKDHDQFEAGFALLLKELKVKQKTGKGARRY